VLAGVLDEIISDGGEESATERLDVWGLRMEVRELSARYRAYPDATYGPALVAWSLLRHGSGSPAAFETRLGDRLGRVGEIVVPLWVLALPVSAHGARRLPADPVVCPTSPEVELAYRGLVDHLRLYRHDDAPELHRTAIVWRVGALVDGLEPTEDADPRRLAMRLGQIRFRLKNDGSLSLLEQQICAHWEDDPFAARRNVLSHLRGRDITFEDVCRFYRDDETTLVSESQAISLAVLREVAEAMREEPPPRGLVESAYAEVSWIDV
jgi:hypothetical protein